MIKKIGFLLIMGIPLLGAGACEKEIEENDYGPEVSSGEVLNHICYNIAPEQIQSIGVGEESVAAKSMSLFSNPSALTEKHLLQLLEVNRRDCQIDEDTTVPCDEHIFYEGIIDLEEEERFDFEQVFYLRAQKEEALAATSETQESTIDEDVCMFTQEMYEQVGIKMTYHNYSYSEYETDPPKAVREREDCGGIENCKLQMKKIEFNQVFDDDGERYHKHFVYHISDQVPFLSRVMKRCITHSLPQHIDDNENGEVDEGEIRIIPVHECRDVIDFRFAT